LVAAPRVVLGFRGRLFGDTVRMDLLAVGASEKANRERQQWDQDQGFSDHVRVAAPQ